MKLTKNENFQIPPAELATSYFEQYPVEAKSPQWTNPCDDKRHLEILPEARRDKCKNLPDFIILGPQKTGTTALMSFLKVKSSKKRINRSWENRLKNSHAIKFSTIQ